MGTGPPTGALPVEPPLRYPRYVAYDAAPYRPVVPYRSPYSFQRLDSLLSTVISERITPGFAITVIYRDTLVYNKGWGAYSYADRRTPFAYPYTLRCRFLDKGLRNDPHGDGLI
jgi:CubicO group peptidase (beta-lactamase class C family)